MKKLVLLFLLMVQMMVCFSDITVVTYRGPESVDDKRMDYPVALLTAALDITKSEYGEYNLIPSPSMNSKRAQTPEVVDSFENYIVEASVNEQVEGELLSIKIPTTKGLYGYRLFIIDVNNQSKYNDIKTIEQLKKISLGQGATWFDVKILEDAGFTVVKGPTYPSLINMLVSGRFDAFPRGVNEAFKEVETLRNDYLNLAVENKLCVYYPLPKFFYTSKKNTLIHERLTKGLLMIIDNGTFDDIWLKFNSDYIKNAKLEERTIFSIPNKYIPMVVPLDDPKFWYVP